MRPQHIAIPMSNITSGIDGRPVLTFYAQLNSETVISSNVLMMAVMVRLMFNDVLINEFTVDYNRKLKIFTEMLDFFKVLSLR